MLIAEIIRQSIDDREREIKATIDYQHMAERDARLDELDKMREIVRRAENIEEWSLMS